MSAALKDVRGIITGKVECQVLDSRTTVVGRHLELLIEDPDGFKHWIRKGDTLSFNVRIEVES